VQALKKESLMRACIADAASYQHSMEVFVDGLARRSDLRASN